MQVIKSEQFKGFQQRMPEIPSARTPSYRLNPGHTQSIRINAPYLYGLFLTNGLIIEDKNHVPVLRASIQGFNNAVMDASLNTKKERSILVEALRQEAGQFEPGDGVTLYKLMVENYTAKNELDSPEEISAQREDTWGQIGLIAAIAQSTVLTSTERQRIMGNITIDDLEQATADMLTIDNKAQQLNLIHQEGVNNSTPQSPYVEGKRIVGTLPGIRRIHWENV